MATNQTDNPRLAELAKSLDCMTVDDLCALAKITPITAQNWRKSGRGPGYTLIGNNYLYPRSAVAEFISTNVHSRKAGEVS